MAQATKRIKTRSSESGEGEYLRLHPNWVDFILYCHRLKFGQIEKLKIKDGLPMIAEEIRRRVDFNKKEGADQ